MIYFLKEISRDQYVPLLAPVTRAHLASYAFFRFFVL